WMGKLWARDLVGQTFGSLVVESRAANIGKQVAFLCRCVCGTHTVISAGHLKSDSTKSCGCLRFIFKDYGRPCSKCDLNSPDVQFGLRKKQRGLRRNSECNNCKRLYAKSYNVTHKEKRRINH